MKIEIQRLFVETKDRKEILKDFSLTINKGEIHAIMGPNGTGKSTLSKVLLNSPFYDVVDGDIVVDDISILDMSTDKRARLGMFLAFQNPISIDGVTNTEFLKTAMNTNREHPIGTLDFIKLMDSSLKDLQMENSMMYRFINQDFSGGEKKKNEILQMKLLNPKFLILDELDSGLDVDSLKTVCRMITTYLSDNPETSVLIITHYPRILEYIRPHYVHMMNHGKIQETGDFSLAKKIEKDGYLSTSSVSGVTGYE